MANEVMCPYCGAMISEKATVCRHCGRILSGSVKYDADGTGVWYGDAPDGHTGEEAARMRRKSRGVLWLVIALCTLLAIGFIGLFAYFAFDLASGIIENNDAAEVDSIINEITGTDPTEGADDINTLPDLPGGVLSDQINLLNKYVEALQKNDREAAAKLFHPAILEAYDNGFRDYGSVFGLSYTWIEWLEFNIRRALGQCRDETEQETGINEVRSTLKRIRCLRENEDMILCLLTRGIFPG